MAINRAENELKVQNPEKISAQIQGFFEEASDRKAINHIVDHLGKMEDDIFRNGLPNSDGEDRLLFLIAPDVLSARKSCGRSIYTQKTIAKQNITGPKDSEIQEYVEAIERKEEISFTLNEAADVFWGLAMLGGKEDLDHQKEYADSFMQFAQSIEMNIRVALMVTFSKFYSRYQINAGTKRHGLENNVLSLLMRDGHIPFPNQQSLDKSRHIILDIKNNTLLPILERLQL